MPYLNGHKPIRPKAHVLNVLEQRYNARFYEAIAAVMALRTSYLRDRYIFVRGEAMIPILRGLGAREEDFEAAKHISHLTGPDPTLDFRTVTYGRYCIDPETRSIRRLETQPYTLTEQEDYKRHDSGIPRMFDEAPTAMQGNTVVQALMLFKALVFQGVPLSPRPKLDYAAPQWIVTMFNARTHTHQESGIYGEPALEGVHSDGSDHTMTVMLGTDNMRADSAVTYIHDNRETTGVRTAETDPTLIRGRVQHQGFLDTLMFCDHDFKHSVTSVYQDDPGRPTTRDMLVVFTRKPKVDGHVSGYADTLELHAEAPLHVPMWLP
ncbi:2OG-Fe dioxygenase-domain-containing protein [Microdochium trichocladiopsis]|uniref:2OG-Fe dioxygenase-domain-containing protein n=1 Tax=Microdochium trichocladiopsis TaxID=1682393 RepID=A0A9P9BLN3_9PEZI|nr:2OG-Fe dioxygenase-domain-containing protein [Microdochium trichocladiopsis]KAH7025077.1 2OG-Fe dioxygenase-domain-containing protein [Microdochium trichocladiopsis]